jgi:hypothetical protein
MVANEAPGTRQAALAAHLVHLGDHLADLLSAIDAEGFSEQLAGSARFAPRHFFDLGGEIGRETDCKGAAVRGEVDIAFMLHCSNL